MEDSVQIKKFELSDIPQFGNLCDESEWYSPQVRATTGTYGSVPLELSRVLSLAGLPNKQEVA